MTDVHEGLQLGPIGHKVVFENDRVRVWEVLLEPGQTQPMHRHDLPYVVVVLEGGQGKITSLSGESRYTDEAAGDIVFQPAGAIHMYENIGKTRYRNRLVELKVTRPDQIQT